MVNPWCLVFLLHFVGSILTPMIRVVFVHAEREPRRLDTSKIGFCRQ